MHVLIIPSEEFVPDNNPVCGIFQYHQAAILKNAGYKVGVISINLTYTIPMLLKSLIYKILRKKTGNVTDFKTFKEIILIGYQKIVKPSVFLSKIKIDDIPVFRIEGFYYLKPMENRNYLGWKQAGISAVSEYIKEYGKPDIIHAHNAINAGILSKEIKKKYNIPYLITEHSTSYIRGKITSEKILKRVESAFKNSSALYAVSQPFCDLLNQLFKTVNFTCLPNVLDPYLEDHMSIQTIPYNQEFKFLNIAELHPKKDHFTLIKAFQIVQNQRPFTKLYIGGDGELDGELKRFVAMEGMDNVVIFLGQLNRDEVIEWFKQTNCLVLSSKFETFGVVLIEAMLFGKPVIATYCGGPEDIIEPEVGLLVPKENVIELANAMLEIMDKFSDYQPEVISEFTIRNYGREAFLNRINNAYTQLV